MAVLLFRNLSSPVTQAQLLASGKSLSARRVAAPVCALALALFSGAAPARAYDVLDRTFLVGIRQGSRLSDEVARLGRGGYELSGGGAVDFRSWYGQRWTEMRADFMSQITERFGLLWGVSSGEWGAKYRIAPGFKVGAILQTEITRTSSLSISFTTTLGGRLREKTCMADYGDIAGVQQVNCRLAASTLTPADSLKYVLNMRPPDHTWLGLQYQARF